MEHNLIAAARASYAFENWPRPASHSRRNSRHLPVLAPCASPLPLVERTALPGGDYVDLYADEAGRAVSVRVVGYSDSEAAYEGLLTLLASSMFPGLPTAEEKGIVVGDVAFTAFGSPPSSVFFVRNWLVIAITSEGEKAFSVQRMADLFDDLAQKWT